MPSSRQKYMAIVQSSISAADRPAFSAFSFASVTASSGYIS